MKHLKVGLLLISVLSVLVASCSAGTITYTDYATVSGTLGGIPFSNALFTVVMVNDTNNVLCGQGSCIIYGGTVTFSLSGFGGGGFIGNIFLLDDQVGNPAFAAFGDNLTSSGGLGTINDPAFSTYDLTTAIGPIPGPCVNVGGPTETTLGELIYECNGDSVFTAALGAPVPEPGTLSLLGIGLAAAFRRKFAR